MKYNSLLLGEIEKIIILLLSHSTKKFVTEGGISDMQLKYK
jgi:hypothetical protein